MSTRDPWIGQLSVSLDPKYDPYKSPALEHTAGSSRPVLTVEMAKKDAVEWMGKYQTLTVKHEALMAAAKDLQNEVEIARERNIRYERWIDKILIRYVD